MQDCWETCPITKACLYSLPSPDHEQTPHSSQQTPAAYKPPNRSLYLTTENDYDAHSGLYQCVQLELNAAVQPRSSGIDSLRRLFI